MNRLIVLSMDALEEGDLGALLALPNAARIFRHAARVQAVRSILPTLTYPCHATILTGCWPERHGVTSNLALAPVQRPTPWRWLRVQNRELDDLLFATRRAGLRTASVYWPTTGWHPAVDWLIPEYWPQEEGESLTQAMARMGAGEDARTILEQAAQGVDPREHPAADAMAVRIACAILRIHRPDLLLLHPANLDEARHRHGTQGPHVLWALTELDDWLGALWESASQAWGEDVNLALLSDHGQRDVGRVLAPNVALREAGLLRDESDWDAYCLASGMCAEVHLSRDSEALRGRVEAILRELEGQEICKLLSREQAKARRLDGDFAFFLMGEGAVAMTSRSTGALLQDLPRRAGSHGYAPETGPSPVFLGVGPGFRAGATLEACDLADEAPTLAALLGASLPRAQGRVLRELLV